MFYSSEIMHKDACQKIDSTCAKSYLVQFVNPCGHEQCSRSTQTSQIMTDFSYRPDGHF